MAKLDSLTISVDASDAALSLRSILDNFAAIGDCLELGIDLLDGTIIGGGETGDLFRCEAVNLPATGAGELHRLQILPGDGYLEFVAALASRVNGNIVFSHGWPILSVGVASSTVAKAGRVASLPGGGVQ